MTGGKNSRRVSGESTAPRGGAAGRPAPAKKINRSGVPNASRTPRPAAGEARQKSSAVRRPPSPVPARGRKATNGAGTKGRLKNSAAGQRQKPENKWVYPENAAIPPGYTPPQKSGNERKKSPAPPPKKKAAPSPEQRLRRQKRRRRTLRKIRSAVLHFLVVNAALWAILLVWYRSTFYSELSSVSDVKYMLGELPAFTADSAAAYEDGEIMINFTRVAEWLGMAQVGDVHSMRFVMSDPKTDSAGSGSEENAVFHYSSRTAYVNGATVQMSAPARFDFGVVWVPASFVADYMTGIKAEISRDKVKLSTEEKITPAFRLKHAAPLKNADEPV